MNDYEIALDIATKAHAGQFRHDGVTPYLIHPIAVAQKFHWPLNVIAILHDVLEDSPTTKQELLDKGIPLFIVEAVEVLTKKPNENYLDYILRIKQHDLATLVKIADIKHNMDGNISKAKRNLYIMSIYLLNGEKIGNK